MIVVDTSFVYALLDRADRRHDEAAAWYAASDDELITTPLVIAETDYLATRLGEPALRAFRGDLEGGVYGVDWWPGAGRVLVDVARRVGLPIGLADASIVATAARHETIEVATFDHRRFRALRPLTGEPAFRLLPADAA